MLDDNQGIGSVHALCRAGPLPEATAASELGGCCCPLSAPPTMADTSSVTNEAALELAEHGKSHSRSPPLRATSTVSALPPLLVVAPVDAMSRSNAADGSSSGVRGGGTAVSASPRLSDAWTATRLPALSEVAREIAFDGVATLFAVRGRGLLFVASKKMLPFS